MRRLHQALITGFALALAPALSGCGVLLGNIKPVAEKSETYGVMDLSKESADWSRLDSESSGPNGAEENPEATEVSDVAYQSRRTASVISLNSACREKFGIGEQNLRSFTSLLFLGVADITLREERELNVQGSSALQTTIRGKLNGEQMMFRTVVLRRQNCVYDLMYVARPRHFSDDEPWFDKFAGSLRLK